MKPVSRIALPALLSTTCLLAALAPAPAHAALIEWTGATSTDFATGSNWVGGTAPLNNLNSDSATFYAASFVRQPTLGSGRSIAGLIFGNGSSSSGAVTLSLGSQNFNIGSGGIIMNQNAGASTINITGGLRLRAWGNQTWTNNSTNAFTVSGGVWGSANAGAATTVTLSGSGNFIFNSVAQNEDSVTDILSINVATSGNGTVHLNAANTYTGSTSVTSGRLVLGSGGSITSSSSIAVGSAGTLDVSAVSGFSLSSGQTLTGVGTVAGDVSVGAGVLAIGSSPGTMTFEDDLAFTLSSVANFEINALGAGNYDLALGLGNDQTVTFDGTLNVAFLDGFGTVGSFQIFDFENYVGDFDSVFFSGLASGYNATFDSLTGTVSVVPEPGAISLVTIGLLAVLIFLRRRGNAGTVRG